MNDLTLHDKTAVKIKAKRKKILDKASLFDCEGDEVWVPNSLCEYISDVEELTIEEWFYTQLVEEGKL